MRDGKGRGRVGLQSLNPSLSHPVVGAKILPHPRPTTFVGRKKIVIPIAHEVPKFFPIFIVVQTMCTRVFTLSVNPLII